MPDKTPRVCNSAGHGLGSRTAGQVDPGADVLAPYSSEASVVLSFVKRLDRDCAVLFANTPGAYHMLRNAGAFYKADDEAYAHACDLFQEFHTNAAAKRPKRDSKKVGVEVYYEDAADAGYAEKMAAAISKASGLPNRGARYRGDLAVLNPHPGMTQVLVELFFGTDADDVAAWTAHSEDVELAVLNVMLAKWGWRPVKSLPRKWSLAYRAIYRARRWA